jgi:hypothetical protein
LGNRPGTLADFQTVFREIDDKQYATINGHVTFPLPLEKVACGAFSDVPSFPPVKGATFTGCRIGRVLPP